MNMPLNLAREIEKLRVRLEEYVEASQSLTNKLKTCMERLRELNTILEELERNPDNVKLRDALRLKLEVVSALGDALSAHGEMHHEESHILESYAALLTAVEEKTHKVMKTLEQR